MSYSLNRLAVTRPPPSNTRNSRVTAFNTLDYINQPPPPPTLSTVLVTGNVASTDINMNNKSIINATQVKATLFVGDVSGNITTATRATNIAGGTGGSIPYQTAVNTTALLPNGTVGQVLTSQGTTVAPQWTTLPSSTAPSLSSVLTTGNQASTAIDMSGNNITNANQITATTFVGDLSGNALKIKTTSYTGASATLYPTFVSGSGNVDLFIDNTTSPLLTYNPSTSTLSSTTFSGSVSNANTLASNSSGTLTITGGSASNTVINALNGTIDLQSNSTSIAKINSSGIQSQALNLTDNAGTPHLTGLSSTWFGTGSVNYINLLPVATGAGINGTQLNIGAYTNSSATTTKQPFSNFDSYATTYRQYTSATDTTPLTITGTTTSKTLKTISTTTDTTLTLLAEYANTGSYNCQLDLKSSASGNQYINMETRDAFGDFSVLNMKNNNVNLFTGIPASDSMIQTGIQLSDDADIYYAIDTYANSPFYVSRVNLNGWTWGTGSVQGNYPAYTPIPSLTSLMNLSTGGVLTFGANTNGIQNRTTSTTITYSGNPLTLTGSNLSFRSYQINFTGTTNAIGSYSFSSVPINADYTIAVYNGGTGNATFASTATYRFNGGVTFTIPTLRYAVIKVQQLSVNATTIFFLTGTLF
jgi:hypothetical protein